MAVVKIVRHEFTDRETNKVTPYERLAIIGYVGGEVHTLELRLEKSELLLAKMLFPYCVRRNSGNGRETRGLI